MVLTLHQHHSSIRYPRQSTVISSFLVYDGAGGFALSVGLCLKFEKQVFGQVFVVYLNLGDPFHVCSCC